MAEVGRLSCSAVLISSPQIYLFLQKHKAVVTNHGFGQIRITHSDTNDGGVNSSCAPKTGRRAWRPQRADTYAITKQSISSLLKARAQPQAQREAWMGAVYGYAQMALLRKSS